MARCVLAAAAMAAAACTDAQQPVQSTGPGREPAAARGEAFYYYGDERILLEADPSEITVESPVEPRDLAGAALSRLGMRVESAARMPQAPGHWVLRVTGADRSRVTDAAARLRETQGIGFAASVYRVVGTGERVALMNRVGVRMRDGWTQADLARLTAETGTRVVRGPVAAEPDVVWLAYRPGTDPLEEAARIHEHPLVAWADPDKVQDRRLHAVPTDPFYANQYYARNAAWLNGVRVDVNAEWAWDLTMGAWAPSAGPLVVAVVDDGVQVSHPDLNSTGALGYDAFTGTFSAWGCTSCANNPGGSFSHGTAVAGIIRADHNNGLGLAGIAPAVRLMPIRIFNDFGNPASDNQIAQALNTAWYNGAMVMNNSWGGGPASTAITSAINRAVTEGRGGKGTVMVFSAGNTSERSTGHVGGVNYPGTLSNVLTVSAINRTGGIADYAPNGSAIDVVAPTGHTTGECIGDVVTVDLTGSRGCNDGPGGNVDYSSTFSGTSAAAPQVAAIAAMVLSRNGTWTEQQIRDRIKASADPWGTATTFGNGKANAYRALVGRVGLTLSGPSYVSSLAEQTWTANATGGAGTYRYRWERADGTSGQFYSVSTARTYESFVETGDRFTLRVTVTDGPDNHAVTRSMVVSGPGAGCASVRGGEPGAILLPPACP
jgi:hypothetical protein